VTIPTTQDPVTASRDAVVQELRTAANRVRALSLTMVERAGLGHPGGDLSAADILVTLYLAVLRINPAAPLNPSRDRFVMSKGHSSAAFYATLAQAGYFDPSQLDEFMAPLSPLNGHPKGFALPGIEASTGPLGHGLPVSVGMAIAGRLDGTGRQVFCLVGDGELQEGSNWEALMVAGHRGLDNLTVIVDRNGLQQGAPTEETNGLEPLADKARAFRWGVVEVDGHDHAQMLDCFAQLPVETGRPSFVIAHTHKGYGVSFIQDRVDWHHRIPTQDELVAALAELEDNR
jgi:transketolase